MKIKTGKDQTLSKDYMLYSYTISPEQRNGRLTELNMQKEFALKNFIQVDSERIKNPKLHFPINMQLLKSLAGVEIINTLPIENKFDEKKTEQAQNSDEGHDINQKNNEYIFNITTINLSVFIAWHLIYKMETPPQTDTSDNNPNQFPNKTKFYKQY